MLENNRLSSTNPVTLVFPDFSLSGFVVVNPVVVCSITFIIGILMNARSVPTEAVPCPEPYIQKASVFE